jgi:hypothetical protein
MHRTSAIGVLIICASALPSLAFLGFGLLFAPGWSNGWGIPQREVWPLGLTAIVSLAAFSVMTGMAAITSIASDTNRQQDGSGLSRSEFGIWLACNTILAAIISIPVYLELYADAAQLWP